jgi:glutaminyl-peptide cyclotransferase
VHNRVKYHWQSKAPLLLIGFTFLVAYFAYIQDVLAAGPVYPSRSGETRSAVCSASKGSSTPVYGYRIVNDYPHDPGAFTQGLFFSGGFLYESTGRYGYSSVRQVELTTGKVVKSRSLPVKHFGEGLTGIKDWLIQLTWRSQLAFVYAKESLRWLRTFKYNGEGWGITENGSLLIVSDGSAKLSFRDPATFEEIRGVQVCDQGVPVMHLNELEYIQGEIFANVWHSDRIARIAPATGEVLGWVDLSGLRRSFEQHETVGVLNGIAYDPRQNRIYVTGKYWPKLFEIELLEPK